MTGSRRSASYWIEAHGPIAAGLLSLIALWFARGTLLPLMAAEKLAPNNLFTAVFGWASIQTGCVFAIYGFVAGKTDGFIAEVRNTRSMRRYNKFIMRAIISGFILTLTSMPLIAWKFNLKDDDVVWYCVFALWFAVFIWAFFSFARVAYIFGLLVQTDARPRP